MDQQTSQWDQQESQAASLPRQIDVYIPEGPEPIGLIMCTMGTPDAYVLTRPEYERQGGVGCRVCWRWMEFGNYKSHKAGKKHTQKMGEPSIQEIPPSDSKETAITAPEAVFEILFPAASHKQSIFTSDPDEILDGMKTSQASVKDGDPVPTV